MLRLIMAAGMLLSLPLSAADRLYKWVDDHGKIQYSDKPPNQPATKGMTEINRRGMVVGHTEGVLTPEQKAAKEAEILKEREEERKSAEARRRDKALAESFNNVREIDAMRDRNLEQVRASIQSDQQRIDATNKRLEEYQKQVANLEKKKRKVPDDLLADIAGTNAEIAKLGKNIEQKKLELQLVRDRAEADKIRLVELKGPSAR